MPASIGYGILVVSLSDHVYYERENIISHSQVILEIEDLSASSGHVSYQKEIII